MYTISTGGLGSGDAVLSIVRWRRRRRRRHQSGEIKDAPPAEIKGDRRRRRISSNKSGRLATDIYDGVDNGAARIAQNFCSFSVSK